MAYKHSEIGHLVRLYPEKAAVKIRRALRAGGTEVRAAERLGCGRRSLQRWIAQLRTLGHDVRLPAAEESAA